MEYNNPKPIAGINITRHQPLKTFLKLLMMAAILAAVVIVLLNVSAHFIAKIIPFSFERVIAKQFSLDKVETSTEQTYLQNLADQILAQSSHPQGIDITVHYSNEDVLNAYATIGGHVYFYKGLVEKLKTENALAMVMAHEIAHVVNRDPITALGRGLTTAIALSAIFGSSDNALIRRFVGGGEMLTSLKYSRDHERHADSDGYEWIVNLYGHGCGTQALFELFERKSATEQSKFSEILTTHPYASKRLQNIQDKQPEICQTALMQLSPNKLYRR